MLPDTDDPGRFAAGSVLGAGDRDLVVRASRPYRDKGLIVAFEGVRDRIQAEALRGIQLTASIRRDLEDGEFWPEDLVGLEAVAPDGSSLGTVSGVVVSGAQDRLVVTTVAGAEVEVPFVNDLVGDPEGGRIVIDAPEGLF